MFARNIQNAMFDFFFGGVAWSISAPTNLYFALVKTAVTPTDTGSTIDEPTWSGYARKLLTANQTNFPAASGGLGSNATEIGTWTPDGVDTDDIVGIAIVSASSAGNLLYYKNFAAPVTPIEDVDIRIKVGDLDADFSAA